MIESEAIINEVGDDSIKLSALSFLNECSRLLELPFDATCTSIILYYKFLANKSKNCDQYMSDYLVIGSIINLVCKINNIDRNVRDVVNVSYHVLHPNSEFLPMESTYWKLRDSLIECEIIVCRFLKFNFEVELPHHFLEDWAANLLLQTGDNPEELNEHLDIINAAWYFANESIYCEDIITNYSALSIAKTCIYLGLSANFDTENQLSTWLAQWDEGEKESFEEIIKKLTKNLGGFNL